MVFYGFIPSIRVLAAPLFIGVAIMASLGMGLIFSALNVRFRDVTVILPFITQVWMFLTPTFYPISLVPERFQYIWALNPLVGAVQGFRWALFGIDPGPWSLIGIGFFSAVVLMITGITYFLKAEEIFPDII
jgi:lipopolysaccharide transport system permease protein